MKKYLLISATIMFAMLFAFTGCDLLPFVQKEPDPFEADGLETVRPYILENPNYTVTNGVLGVDLAIKTYVTDDCILKNTFKRFDYYVTVGDKLYTFFKMDVGSTSSLKIETQETRDSLTKEYTDCFKKDWVFDEDSQCYRVADGDLTIGETSVTIHLGYLTYRFEDIGRTKISVPNVIKP